MADVVENEAKMAYMRPSGTAATNTEEPRGPSKGFVVREAPWATNSEKVNLKAFCAPPSACFWNTVCVEPIWTPDACYTWKTFTLQINL